MRATIDRSFFVRGMTISAAAAALSVAKATAYDQRARIHKALKELDFLAQNPSNISSVTCAPRAR